MKVAVVQLSHKHTEILGTFLEFLIKSNIEFVIYYNIQRDPYTFVKYYKKLFKRIFDVRATERLSEEKEEYDKFIFTTSDDGDKADPWFREQENAKKCIFVHHLASHWDNYMTNNIIVSPVVNLENSSCIIPIYREYTKLHSEPSKNNFAIVGAIKPHQRDKDLSLLIDLLEHSEGLDFKIFVFMRKKDWNVISERHPFLKDHPKIEFYPGLCTDKMIEKLKEVKFIIPLAKKNGWNYHLRLTGSIPLAVNLNMPMIMDKKLARIYNLAGGSVLYENNISEVIDKVMEMKNNEYYRLVEGVVLYKREQYKRNKEILSEFIRK